MKIVEMLLLVGGNGVEEDSRWAGGCERIHRPLKSTGDEAHDSSHSSDTRNPADSP